jgi:hypothetical protein
MCVKQGGREGVREGERERGKRERTRESERGKRERTRERERERDNLWKRRPEIREAMDSSGSTTNGNPAHIASPPVTCALYTWFRV